MLCASRVCPDSEGLRMLGTVGILTLVLCSCLGQAASRPWNLAAKSSQEHEEELVFIHMESSLYSLPCSPVEMEVADPTYGWMRDREESKLFLITKEGHLLFQHFQARDSGKYSCTISYKKHRASVSQTFHYRVFGYHVLGGLDIVLLFHSKICGDERTERFLWDLQEKLKQLEIEQHCRLHLTDTFCFPSLSNLSEEVIIQVQLEVSLFGPQWDEHCNPQDVKTVTDCYQKTVRHSIRQVRLALKRFFKKHKSFRVTGADIPSINFSNNFASALKTKECYEGYGQTKQLQTCLDCCIACPPGMFSPRKYSQCLPCPIGTYSLMYGAALCTPCEDGMITSVAGASSMKNCFKMGSTNDVLSKLLRNPLQFLIILPALAAFNLLLFVISCYWFCRENWTPEKTESTTRRKKVIDFFKIPARAPRLDLPAVSVITSTS